MYDNLIHFYIPGLNADYIGFYLYMNEYMRKFPERFMPNIKISSYYGSFNNTIWNGGRYVHGIQLNKSKIEKIIQDINKEGIAVRYTYTNNQIEEKHLSDTYCNLTMDLADNGKNEVLVNSPILEKYLRKQYPNFKYILSTTACERNINNINSAAEKYDLVVLDYRDNHNISFLNQIENKEKIEILLDEVCPSNCRFRKQHYSNISKINIYNSNSTESRCLNNDSCGKQLNFYENLLVNNDTNLTVDELYGRYFDMGFRHFKLIGRNIGNPLFAFESYIYYLTKKETRDYVRYDLLEWYMDYVCNELKENASSRIEWRENKLNETQNNGI